MKKYFKKITVLLFASILFIMPATTALAASVPVLIYSDGSSKMFAYQPDPYHLAANRSVILQDTTNAQLWFVPAGHAFFTEFNLAERGPFASFTVQIYKLEPTMHLIYTETLDTYWGFFNHNLDPISSDANYLIVVIAITDIRIANYQGLTYIR